MKYILMTLLVISGFKTWAQVEKIDLNKDLPVTEFGKKQTSLFKLKDHENNLRWAECAKNAPQVFKTRAEVQGWIALTWLRCLEQETKKNGNAAQLDKALKILLSHRTLLHEGPWSEELQTLFVKLRLVQLEKQVSSGVSKNAGPALDFLLDGSLTLDKEQKSKVFELLGDIALQQKKNTEARFLYEESQNQKDSKSIQSKIDKLSALPNGKATGTTTEAGLEESAPILQVLKTSEPLKALKEVVSFLNQYPGSRIAKRLKDKPLEIYNSFSERSKKDTALVEMIRADSSRLLDWSQNLHRRADFLGAQVLAEKALLHAPHSPQTTSLLWIAGRSAHFMGEYEKALEHFANLIEFHAGTDEASEAAFRSGLIQIRQKKFPTAILTFDKLLQEKRERYDLSAKYWLIRALQETKDERATSLAAELIERYPFSYYGLKLQAENRAGKLEWPVPKEKTPFLESELYLVGEQKASWRRFRTLSNEGWTHEARAELVNLPFIKSSNLKMTLAKKMAERQQFALTIGLVNEAMEKNPALRREEFLKLGFPDVFTDLYKEEARRYGVDVVILRSLTRQESAFNLRAVSSSNALGLMQMIPPTAQEVARKLNLKIELPGDMFRPEVNIPMGSFYISQMLGQFDGNLAYALAAYNAGPNRFKIWLESRADISEGEIWFDELPWSETSFYVKAILRNILLYRLVSEGSFTLKPVLWQDLIEKKTK